MVHRVVHKKLGYHHVVFYWRTIDATLFKEDIYALVHQSDQGTNFDGKKNSGVVLVTYAQSFFILW